VPARAPDFAQASSRGNALLQARIVRFHHTADTSFLGLGAARRLREEFGATNLAAFFEEAAEVYERRGLFRFRF
jgi:propanediol dehydratase small subunit